MPRPSSLFLLAALGACSVGDDAPTVDQSCSDPQYGDGVCNAELTCAVPDIDCLRTFADDATAADWYRPLEASMATQGGTQPRRLLPPSDPRYQQARSLLDRGWDAFRRSRPVGELGDKRPGLVVIEEPKPNAFVMRDPETKRAGFSVQVFTGLLELDVSDDARLAVMMHELQHAVGLHVVEGVPDRVRTHYVATGGEPIGRDQIDDPTARAAITAWRDVAEEIGVHPQTELGGFPLDGDLHTVMNVVLATGIKQDAAKCARANSLVTQLRRDVVTSADPLSGALTINLASLPPRVNTALVALKSECLATFPLTFIDVVAAMYKTTPAAISMAMSASDRALVANKHVVDAINALVLDRRAKLRGYQTMLPGQAAWTAARYFSTEEDADDVASFVLDAAGLDPAAGGEIMLALVAKADAEAGARCQSTLDAGAVPPYGANLLDEHHATCWRVHHVEQLATTPRTSARVTVPARGQLAERPTRALPRREPGVVIMY